MNEMPSVLSAIQEPVAATGMGVLLEIIAIGLLGYIAFQLSRVLSRLAQFSFVAREIHGEVAAQRKPEQIQSAIDESLREIRTLLKDNRETVRALNERTSLLSALNTPTAAAQSPALTAPATAAPATPGRPAVTATNATEAPTPTLHLIARDDDSRRKSIPG